MGIRESIQSSITAYCGCEERIIKKTMSECGCSRKAVENNIDWLIKKGYCEYVDYADMKDGEKDFYNSDHCEILKTIKPYNEIEYLEEERKRKESEDKLTNIEKFKLYFSRMEKEFNRTEFCYEKCYSLEYGLNDVTVTVKDSGSERKIRVDFGVVSDIIFDESDNSIAYKTGNKYYTFSLRCIHTKGCLQHHLAY